jgi:hypothetical protein
MKSNVQFSTEIDITTNVQCLQIIDLDENLQKSFVDCPKTAKLLFFYFYNLLRKRNQTKTI